MIPRLLRKIFEALETMRKVFWLRIAERKKSCQIKEDSVKWKKSAIAKVPGNHSAFRQTFLSKNLRKPWQLFLHFYRIRLVDFFLSKSRTAFVCLREFARVCRRVCTFLCVCACVRVCGWVCAKAPFEEEGGGARQKPRQQYKATSKCTRCRKVVCV